MLYEETTFYGLPFEMVCEILSKLRFRDQLNARLVSTYWFDALSSVFKPVCNLNDQTLNETMKIFQDATFSKLQILNIENMKQQLEIYSSRRNKILPAHKLIIGSGNNFENLKRLLRYYCTTCIGSLELSEDCFTNVKLGQMRSLGDLRFGRVVELSMVFKVTPEGLFQHANPIPTIPDHFSSLSAFLRQIRCPYLKKFKMNYSPCFRDDNLLSASIKINESLGIFFQGNCHYLKSLEFITEAGDEIRYLQHLPILVNLTNLKFVITSAGPRYTEFKAGASELFNTLHKLETLHLNFHSSKFNGFDNDCSKIELICRNNKLNLKSLTIGHRIKTFSWINSNVFNNLVTLHLEYINSSKTTLENLQQLVSTGLDSEDDGLKLFSLRNLHIMAFPSYVTCSYTTHTKKLENKSAKNRLTNLIYEWITLMFPNLKHLSLSYAIPTSSVQLHHILTRLKYLETFKIYEVSQIHYDKHRIRFGHHKWISAWVNNTPGLIANNSSGDSSQPFYESKLCQKTAPNWDCLILVSDRKQFHEYTQRFITKMIVLISTKFYDFHNSIWNYITSN